MVILALVKVDERSEDQESKSREGGYENRWPVPKLFVDPNQWRGKKLHFRFTMFKPIERLGGHDRHHDEWQWEKEGLPGDVILLAHTAGPTPRSRGILGRRGEGVNAVLRGGCGPWNREKYGGGFVGGL